MKIGLLPRLLPGGRPGVGGDDDPLLVPLGSGEEINRAVLSGLIAAEPLRATSRDGDPITVLLVSFSHPTSGRATARVAVRSKSPTPSPTVIAAGWVSVDGSGLPVS